MNAQDTPSLADFLAQQMRAHNLTQAEVVRRSQQGGRGGVKQPWLVSALKGRPVNPTARIICALARGVNTTPEALIGPACRTATAGATTDTAQP